MSDIKVLALGSAVQLKDDDTIYIVISRGFKREHSEIIVGYVGAPHPYGQNTKYKNRMFTANSIANVLHAGYEDEHDKIFVSEQIKHAKESTRQTERDGITPDTQNGHESKTSPEVSSTKNMYSEKDPFYNLKNK